MKLSQLEELCRKMREMHGDVEATMVGTLCPMGYSMGDAGIMKDVFESTICGATLINEDSDFSDFEGKRVLIHWQT